MLITLLQKYYLLESYELVTLMHDEYEYLQQECVEQHSSPLDHIS